MGHLELARSAALEVHHCLPGPQYLCEAVTVRLSVTKAEVRTSM